MKTLLLILGVLFDFTKCYKSPLPHPRPRSPFHRQGVIKLNQISPLLRHQSKLPIYRDHPKYENSPIRRSTKYNEILIAMKERPSRGLHVLFDDDGKPISVQDYSKNDKNENNKVSFVKTYLGKQFPRKEEIRFVVGSSDERHNKIEERNPRHDQRFFKYAQESVKEDSRENERALFADLSSLLDAKPAGNKEISHLLLKENGKYDTPLVKLVLPPIKLTESSEVQTHYKNRLELSELLKDAIKKKQANSNFNNKQKTKLNQLFDEDGMLFLTPPRPKPEDGSINKLMDKLVQFNIDEQEKGFLRNMLSKAFDPDEIERLRKIVRAFDEDQEPRIMESKVAYDFADLVQ